MKNLFTCLLDLLFPRTCPGCGDLLATTPICDDCMAEILRTEMGTFRDNSLEQLFSDIPIFERGAAWCFYKYGTRIRRIIPHMKYSSHPEIGEYLGNVAGTELGETNFFEGVDVLVPIPLHRRRHRERGFNQALYIAKGLSEATGIPIDTKHLLRAKNNEQQARKTIAERQKLKSDVFALEQAIEWKGKHIMLVDDIVTTGSTLRACLKLFTPKMKVRVSVFALGMAKR